MGQNLEIMFYIFLFKEFIINMMWTMPMIQPLSEFRNTK